MGTLISFTGFLCGAAHRAASPCFTSFKPRCGTPWVFQRPNPRGRKFVFASLAQLPDESLHRVLQVLLYNYRPHFHTGIEFVPEILLHQLGRTRFEKSLDCTPLLLPQLLAPSSAPPKAPLAQLCFPQNSPRMARWQKPEPLVPHRGQKDTGAGLEAIAIRLKAIASRCRKRQMWQVQF